MKKNGKDIISLLGRLGLKDREGRIYLACLKYTDGLFIHEIVHETRISRSTIDLNVKSLVRRGFLNKVKVGRRLRYFAQSPEAVLFRQKQLVEDLEKAVPLLMKIGGEKKDMEILYFQGAEGFRQIYQDVLLNLKFATGEKKDLLSFTSGIDSFRLFPDMQKVFIDKRIRNGSWYRAIAPASTARVREWNNNAAALRTIKYLPDETAYPFHIETGVYADSMMLYSTVPPVGGVIIRNEMIADSMRSLFNLIWKLLPDVSDSIKLEAAMKARTK